MAELDNSNVWNARQRRSARGALGATLLAIFLISLTSGRDWTVALIHTLVMAVVIVPSIRILLGKGLWRSLWRND
jgi:hypothetical protein